MRQHRSQLAEYRERLQLQARAEAINRVDNAALDNARHVAGPVLDAVISSQAPDPDLRTAAALANATLRDERLAPGFLTPPLTERVRAVRAAGASITIDFARQPHTMHARSRRSDHAALRRHAAECGALISDLDDRVLLIRLHAAR